MDFVLRSLGSHIVAVAVVDSFVDSFVETAEVVQHILVEQDLALVAVVGTWAVEGRETSGVGMLEVDLVLHILKHPAVVVVVQAFVVFDRDLVVVDTCVAVAVEGSLVVRGAVGVGVVPVAGQVESLVAVVLVPQSAVEGACVVGWMV